MVRCGSFRVTGHCVWQNMKTVAAQRISNHWDAGNIFSDGYCKTSADATKNWKITVCNLGEQTL